MVKTLFQASTWNALEAGSFDGAVSVRELLRCAEHTISLRQTECRKTGETITAAVYEYLVDNDGEWGELRFDFENGTAEIVKLADWDTVKSNVFAKAAIRFVQDLPEARLCCKGKLYWFVMCRLQRVFKNNQKFCDQSK